MLYSVVWLHEIGHSIFYAHYGCKKNWLHVTVKPYIFFSTPAPLEINQLYKLTKKQNTIIAYGGILANIFWSIASAAVLCLTEIENTYLLFSIWLFLTLHLIETVRLSVHWKHLFGKRYGEHCAMLSETEISEFDVRLYTNSRLSFRSIDRPIRALLACSRLECGDLSLYVRRKNYFFSRSCQKA